MSRLEKKCFVGSASFHGLLLMIFIFGSVFLASKPKLDIGPVITMLAIPTDRPFNTGGNPNGNPTPPAPAPAPVTPPAPQSQPTPPPPVPQPPQHEEVPPRVEPKKPELKKEVVKEVEKEKGPLPLKSKPDKKETVKKDESAVTKPAISKTVVRRTNDTARIQREMAQIAALAAREKEKREAAEYAQQVSRFNAERSRIAAQVGGIVGGVGKSLSHSTVVEPLGPGGIAFANYGSMVREAYDRAWHVSQDLSDNDSVAVARITIRRDGTVRDSNISRRSGNALLDKSVQRALDAVRFVAPFPESTKDAERTFNIEFNLKTRKAVG